MVVNRTPKQTVDHPERGGKKKEKKKNRGGVFNLVSGR